MVLTTSDDVRPSDARNECGHYVSGRSLGGRQLEGRKEGKEGTRGHRRRRRTVGEKEKNYGLVGHSTHSVYLFLHFFSAGAVTEMFLNEDSSFSSF